MHKSLKPADTDRILRRHLADRHVRRSPDSIGDPPQGRPWIGPQGGEDRAGHQQGEAAQYNHSGFREERGSFHVGSIVSSFG